ncbi:MAG: phosphoribosylglycinamide formyltransferase [Candidatus Marinimicrobia bacterium]|nr:phosphoribosylglycinamide formyltransferase [Candidatus Neomarinimicrobiota bacterium]
MGSTVLKKIAVFASGRGSNFLAVLEQIKQDKIAAEVVCVISDHAWPPVFDIARENSIPTHWVNRKQFSAAEDYAEFLLKLLGSYQTEMILLAGYLKLIPAPIVEHYRNAIINIHPALLPNFGGKGFYGEKVHRAVIESGVRITGVTIHFVDKHYDQGAVIIQEKVDVIPGETPATLAKRVLAVEHRLLPEVVRAYCAGKIEMIDGKVFWNR